MTRKEPRMNTDSTSVGKLADHIAGMETVKEWMESHPEIEFYSVSVNATGKVDAQIGYKGNFAAAVRALKEGAPLGTVTKEISASLYSVERDFGHVKLCIYTGRALVCESRVVGTERVRVPDPDAPMVEVERDLIEWECSPILSTAEHRSSPADDLLGLASE